MALYPVPSGRASDLMIQQRLLSQLQADQRDMLRLQDQLSTGRRFATPSDNAPAAARAMTLQRLVEQKEQTQSNLLTSQSYLSATENAISEVTSLISDIRGLAVTSADTSAGVDERKAIAEQIRRAVTHLSNVGNQQFRGRHLFAGSRSDAAPFQRGDNAVIYHGNAGALNSYGDVDFLVQSNVSGDRIFGAISATARGSVDLQPVVTAKTRLSQLNSGAGIQRGSIILSDGSANSTVDLSKAETLGDVVRLIENNPPQGRSVTVRFSGDRLVVDLDDAGGGALSIKEVGGGRTASDLGILRPVGGGVGPFTGEPLMPMITKTTRLDDLLGIRATAVLESPGADNDIHIEAVENGPALNGFSVHLVDDSLLQAAPGLLAGSEVATFSAAPVAARAALTFSGGNNNLLLTANSTGTALNQVGIEVYNAGNIGNAAQVSYDAAGQVLRIGIDAANNTQIQTVISAINSEGTFTAAYDASETSDGGYIPTAAVSAADAGLVSGNTGNSGGDANTIFVHVQAGQSLAEDVVAAMQAEPDVASRFQVSLDNKDLSTLLQAGRGTVDASATAVTAGGSGAPLDRSGLQIDSNGKSFTFAFDDDTTVDDLLNRLNNSDAGLQAEINSQGNGLNIRSRVSGQDFTIGENGGSTATQLGVRTFDSDTRLDNLNYGRGIRSADGTDFIIRRRDGVELAMDVSGADTLQDVIDLINAHPDNQDANAVLARFTAYGNGLELVDANAAGGSPLAVLPASSSHAAWDLGLIPLGQVQAEADPATADQLTGVDTNPQETHGVFNTLLKLQAAVENGDTAAIERITQLLDEDFDRINFARVELGVRRQGLDALEQRHTDEDIELRKTLSLELDVDMVQTISELTSRQAAMEASLRMIGRTFQMTLLDFV